jgi:RND family efflux transporter MFP subunit
MKLAFAAVPVIAVLAGCGGGSGHQERKAGATHEAAPAAPIAVTVAEAVTANWPKIYEAVGTVQARTSTPLASRMLGSVSEVAVRLGDRVNAGQLLVTIDARDIDAQQAQAEAVLAEARSAPAELESAIAASKAQLDLAQTTFRRMQDLFAKKSVSNQEFDEASARLKLAEAQHNAALARRAQLKAKIDQAEQAVRSAQIARGHARIFAPFSGTVTAKNVEPGMLATPGTPLMTIEQAGPWRLEANIEESKLTVIRAGYPVAVRLDAFDKVINSRVVEVVPSVDPVSRTFIAKIDLPSTPQLRGGQFGRARFALAERPVLAIPAAALVERGQLTMAFVTDGGAARARMITPGERRGESVEVLSGISAGERLISPVPAHLADGARVEVRP